MATMREKLDLPPLDPNEEVVIIPWRDMAVKSPLIVQWMIQRYGFLDDDDPGCDFEIYEILRKKILKEEGVEETP